MRVVFSVLALWLVAAPPLAAWAQAPGPAVPPQPQAADTVPGVPASAATTPGPGRSAPLGTLASLGADYRVGPNDLMDVDVYGVAELKRTVRVNSSGQVSLPLVGNVALAGLTAQQAEALIAEKYAEKYLQNPQVSVFIREFTTQRITIEGAVARPGIYPVTGPVTLLRALALAGGGAQFAELNEIMVFRAGAQGQMQSQTHDLEKIRAGELPDPVVLAEDVIVVKRNAVRTAIRDSVFRDVIDSINPFSSIGK